jgi:hypothetical protein
MMRAQKIAATGDVVGEVNAGEAVVILTPAAAKSGVDVREGGSGGTIIMTLQAPADGQSVISPAFRFQGQLHVTLSGSGRIGHGADVVACPPRAYWSGRTPRSTHRKIRPCRC